jgi:hypothetical protein
MEKTKHGKHGRGLKKKIAATRPDHLKSLPEKDTGPGETDYGGMDLKNFGRNLGCGG